MDNFSISGWAIRAIASLPESHHSSVKVIARYTLEYQKNNRIVRVRRASVSQARPMEVPCGYYINGLGGTLKENDKFFAQLQFMYNLGWLSELDKLSLSLTQGVKYVPNKFTPALRERSGIKRKVRKQVFEKDAHICWLCGFATEPYSDDDWTNPWAPSLDHVVPHSRGGDDSMGNLRTAHRWCNSVRGNREFSKQIMSTRANCQISDKVADPYEAGKELNKIIATSYAT